MRRFSPIFSLVSMLCTLSFFLASNAQATDPFSQVSSVPLNKGTAAWGDYDNDGLLDLAVSGITATNVLTKQIWHNNGNGTFSNLFNGDFGPAARGNLVWADLNNDGYLDLVVVGTTGLTNTLTTGATEILQNLGGTNFVRLPMLIPASAYSSVGVADFDNDGLLDIVVSGTSSTTGRVWRNLGSFVFSTNNMPAFTKSSATIYGRPVRLADVDNDGWPDVLTEPSDGSLQTLILRNLNGTNFAAMTSLSLLSARAEFADYNNDGRLDLFTADDGGRAFVWFNTGTGFTTNSSDFSVHHSLQSPVPAGSWGDFNNDGWPDVFLSWGQFEIPGIYSNNQGAFVPLTFSAPGAGSFIFGDSENSDLMFGAWGDYDNDGKLDLFKSETDYGTGNPAAAYSLYHNDTAVTNTPPSAPSGLSFFSSDGTNVTLHWLAASDGQTPSAGLSYNLRVGTTPGGCDVVSPMADPVSGKRRIPALGNAQLRLFSYLRNLPPGRTYYWSVQAIDGGYSGGAWAPEASFITPLPTAGDLNGDGVVSAAEFNQVLSNYLATSPYLKMTNTIGLGSNTVTFALTNNFAGSFTVEYSTNLTNWQVLGPATPQYFFLDPNASTNPQRFYRLRFP
jgi:hypothetical protein